MAARMRRAGRMGLLRLDQGLLEAEQPLIDTLTLLSELHSKPCVHSRGRL
jgi:hypothetical protein